MEHGFHVHDERHFVETMTLRQAWEVDVHPAEACSGPLDLHISLDIEPRLVLRFEDMLAETDEMPTDPDHEFAITFFFNWSLPAMATPPDLIILSTELAGIGGIDLPIDINAVQSMGALDDQTDTRLSVIGKAERSLVDFVFNPECLCEVLDRVHAVSMYFVEHADGWLD